jgi:hypothetical protein
MSRLTVTVDGKERLLRWDLRAVLEVEEQGYGMRKLLDEIEGDAPTRAKLVMCAAMLNSGARHEGIEATKETADTLPDKLSESELAHMMQQMSVAYIAGRQREHAKDDDDAVVDVVLERLQKKRALKETRTDGLDGSC